MVGLVLPYKRSSTLSWCNSMVAAWREKESKYFERLLMLVGVQ
jgi:hypothetical protein